MQYVTCSEFLYLFSSQKLRVRFNLQLREGPRNAHCILERSLFHTPLGRPETLTTHDQKYATGIRVLLCFFQTTPSVALMPVAYVWLLAFLVAHLTSFLTCCDGVQVYGESNKVAAGRKGQNEQITAS